MPTGPGLSTHETPGRSLRPAKAGAVLLAAGLCITPHALAQPAGTNTAPTIVSGTMAFAKHVIDDRVDHTHAVAAADFNGDGFLDVVASDFDDGAILWYENDGRGGFVTKVLDANLEGAYPVSVGDLDLDGDADVLAAGYLAGVFAWYECDGAGSFTRHDIGTSGGPHSIVAGDVDRDGDMDLLTASQDAATVAWYENDGAQNFTPHAIDTTATKVKRAELADIDGDGDLDAVAASYEADEVAWYENDGQQVFTKHVIDSAADGAYYVFPVDVDGDGDVDVLAANQLDDAIVWYDNDGSEVFTAIPVDDSAERVRTVIAADIDGDGDIDPVGASFEDDTLAWHDNDGRGGFTEIVIDRQADGAYGAAALDMDGDGDIDVLAANRDANEIALYTQIRRHVVAMPIGAVGVIDRSRLQTIDSDDGPADLIYTLTDAPDFGSLRLGGVAVVAGGTFTQADVNAGLLAYAHGGLGSSADGFSFRVQDGGEGGVRPGAGEFLIIVTETGETVVRLPLDEGSGVVAADVSGNGNHGALRNGAVFEANTGDGSAFAVHLDGADDFIDLGPLDAGGSGLTLAVWLNPDSVPGTTSDARLISKASSTSANDHVFMLGLVGWGSSNRVRGRLRVGGTTTTLVATGGALTAGAWHHAALTHDGTEARLYLDGIEVARAPLSGTVDVDPTMPVAVGAQPPGAGGKHFDGLLDDVRIVRRALHASEIAAIVAGCGGGFRTYGAGLAGAGGIVPRIAGSGCPSPGATASLDLSSGLGGAVGGLVLGYAKASVPVLGGTLLVAPLVPVISLVLSGAGPGSGDASVSLRVPAHHGMVGSAFFCQGVVVDPAAPMGLSFTEGLEIAIGW